jgi:WD40 repeat protein
VTSAAAVPTQQQQQQHMAISGSGDGTVRLWNVDTGEQLGCFVASEQPPPLSFEQQQEQAGGAPEVQQQGEQGDGNNGEEGPDASVNAEEQQEEAAAVAVDADAAEAEPDSSKAGAATEQDDKGANEQQQGPVMGDKKSIASKYGGRYHKAREACCAVVGVAVSPDGRTVAAAVEGQQELQLLSLDAATGQMQLLQKLEFSDVSNPASVTFDSAGRLWVVGGVLVRQTESAHVGVAAQNAGMCCAMFGRVWIPAELQPTSLRTGSWCLKGMTTSTRWSIVDSLQQMDFSRSNLAMAA